MTKAIPVWITQRVVNAGRNFRSLNTRYHNAVAAGKTARRFARDVAANELHSAAVRAAHAFNDRNGREA